MRILFLSFLCLLMHTILPAQNRPVKIEILKIKSSAVPQLASDFKVVEVLDDRPDKTYIGMIKTGLSNKKKAIALEKNLEREMLDLSQTILTPSQASKEVRIRIQQLWASEKTTFTRETGIVELQLSFELKNYGQYAPDGSVQVRVEKGGLDVSKKLGKLIPMAFRQAYEKYMKQEAVPYQANIQTLSFAKGYPAGLQKGTYNSFQDVIKNQVSSQNVVLDLKGKNSALPQMRLSHPNQKTINDFAYFDGQKLYLNRYALDHKSNNYLAPQTEGRYLIYLYRASNLSAEAFLGTIGSLASVKLRAAVLDTQTGLLVDVTHKFLQSFAMQHSELQGKFQERGYTMDDILNAFQVLNQKLQ